MRIGLVVSIAVALLSCVLNLLHHHKEDKLKGKIKSWLEMARGVHTHSRQADREDIACEVNSLVKDLGDELEAGRRWQTFYFVLVLLATGFLIGLLICSI